MEDLINFNIDSLSIEQLEGLTNDLRRQLDILKGSRSAISKEIGSEISLIVCPRCHSLHINKDGHDSRTKIQMYECKDCKKKFSALSGTVFSHTHFTYEQIIDVIDDMNNKLSLRKTANKVKKNKNTIFSIRHKILDVLGNIRENIKLSGNVEADELYRTINLKGTKSENMPRASKPRQSNGTTHQGITSHKVCIVSAIDDNDNAFLEIAGTGPVTTEMIRTKLVSKIGDIKVLLTDCKSSYEKVVKENNWNLIQIKAETYVDDKGNSLANINSYHSGFEVFISPFRGVSTKHLQHYLDWYMFSKYLNYTVETVKQTKDFFKTIVSKKTSVTSKNTYDNTSGIDFDTVYADYA